MELVETAAEARAGQIPVGWSRRPISTVAHMKSGLGITSANIDESGRHPCYGGNGLRGYTGTYTHEGEFVLIGRQGALCGNVSRASGKFFASEHAVVCTPHHRVDTRWLGAALERMNLNQYSESSAQPGLSVRKIEKLPLLVPPASEQEAIGTILADIDGLLADLDALLEKKRGLKTGAMQRLLTGRQRLVGFSGEWETASVGTLGRVYGGLTGKSGKDFGRGRARYVPFLNVMTNVTVDPDDLERVQVREDERQNVVRKGDLLFNTSSETPEELAMCAAVTGNLGETYLNSFCFGFRPSRPTDSPLFLAYFFRGTPGRALMKGLAQGSTRYNLSKRTFLSQTVTLPLPEEQQAITTVLADMDVEIAALEVRRAKAAQLREGMMQELLTGRTRLV